MSSGRVFVPRFCGDWAKSLEEVKKVGFPFFGIL